MVVTVSASEPRREFLSYCLSLMRSHSSEHSDSLPVLDISALKHIAYVLDALIYYMRSDTINAPLQPATVSAFNDVDNESWVADQVIFDFYIIMLPPIFNFVFHFFCALLFILRMKTKTMKMTKK